LRIMFLRKKKAIQSKLVRASHFKLNRADAPNIPDEIIVISNHYTSLFEMPILFLIGSVLIVSLKLVDSYTLILAWLFVITRIIHTFVHLGSNNIMRRLSIFA